MQYKKQVIYNQQNEPVFVVLPQEEFLRITKILEKAERKERERYPQEVINYRTKCEYTMVKSWRLYLKLSPSAVAEELGCSLQKYQELEKKEILFASTLARLSGIFNVGIQQLQSID